MGSIAKQMLKRKAREAQKKALSDIRDVAKTPLFILAKPDGTPLLRGAEKGGEDITVTWAFVTHEKADTFCKKLGEEYTDPVVIQRMPAADFLGALFHHLSQADIDFLLLNGETELPLTTIGVKLLDKDEDWALLLDKSRKHPGVNFLLAQVAMTVLQTAAPESAVAVETATYADLVRVTLGKKGHFPTVDLGIVWMLSSAVENGSEPIFFKLTGASPDNPTGEDLDIGPMFFTSYQHAISWPRVLPENVVKALSELKLWLIPYRAMNVLDEVNKNFPVANVDERKPDVFLLDGGCLPMTLKGAKYTDELAYGDEKPAKTFTTIAEEDPVELRKATVTLLARALGIQLVLADPASKEENVDA